MGPRSVTRRKAYCERDFVNADGNFVAADRGGAGEEFPVKGFRALSAAPKGPCVPCQRFSLSSYPQKERLEYRLYV